jgi:hypothetical protein
MDVTTAAGPYEKTLDGGANAREDGGMRSLTWECNHGGE